MTTRETNPALEAALLEGAEGRYVEAEEPGTLRTDQVLHTPDDELDASMGPMELKSAGWVYVWHRRTGVRSLVNRNMLRTQMQKIDPETGRQAFALSDPGIPQKRGTYKCWLHADHEMRALCDEFGFDSCRKSNLTSEFQARLHTRRRHATEYAALEERRQRVERDEDRNLQRRFLESAGTIRQAREAPADKAATADEPPAFSWACEKCGESYSARNKRGHSLAKMHHDKKCPA